MTIRQTNLATNSITIESNTPLFPSISVINIEHFIGFRKETVRLIGVQHFKFESITNNWKIEIENSDLYRKIIKKEEKFESHTPHINLKKIELVCCHSKSTPIYVNCLRWEQPGIGYSVRQVTNVCPKTTKRYVSLFCTDLKPFWNRQF